MTSGTSRKTSNLRSMDERLNFGRELRKTVKRKTHSDTGNTKRDPIELLEASSKGRVERLVPLRYGRMLASPFAFYRGTAIIQAHDLASTPHTGLTQQICGDCHLMNFGGYATAERTLVFDLNDFDETHPGPWEWDVKRLAASLTIASRHLGFSGKTADDIVATAITSYQQHIANYAKLGSLAIWYDQISYDRLLEYLPDESTRNDLKRRIAKAKRQTHETVLSKIAHQVEGRWIMNDAPPGLFHIHGESSLFGADDDWMKIGNWQDISKKLHGEYLTTLSDSHKALLAAFTQQDMAFKVVGVGSVGTRCLALLMTDPQGHPLFLQIKQANQSVLAPYVPAAKSAFKHEGRRVVAGQRLMQSASDHFLGWSTGPSGRHFYFRQLRDMKTSAEIDTYDAHRLKLYASICGWVLARAHARSGCFAPEMSAYLGDGEQFADALVKYANGYADQCERDFESFRTACRSGRLKAQSETDFSAEFSL